jgi:hypothetical protein
MTERQREASRRWRLAHPERSRANSKKWRSAHPDRAKRSAHAAQIKHRYGMTVEDKSRMFASQGNLCAICGSEAPRGRGWHIDHCHSSGRVRGILCGPCNHALGLAGESPRVLEEMAAYLRRHDV